MKNVLLSALFLFLITASGFAKQPTLKKAEIEPSVASVGDTVNVAIEFSGSKDDLREVYFLPRDYADEAPRYYLIADKKSKKNIWHLKGPIPYDAPSGLINLEVTAIDKDGKEIVTKEFKNQMYGKAGLIKLQIN